MRRALATLSALIALAACSNFQDAGLEGNILSPGNFRAGSGVIQSVGVLRNANPPKSAPAAGRAPDPNAYRLYLHMDIGGFQAVDVDNGTFMAGETVELTNDGRVVRVTGTSLNRLKP
jgi:hypothetical protein